MGKQEISFTRVYHNGLSIKECPYGEQREIDGKLYTRFVGECEGCKYFVKNRTQNKVVCNHAKETEN